MNKIIYRILLVFGIACMGIATMSAQKRVHHTVVIDAGHGGKDTGAIDNGVKEKDINLGVAKELARLINKDLKNVDAVMTRSGDVFLSLQERASIANRNHADLFISIHTNSVDAKNPNRKSVAGASVYALGLHKDESNLKVAQRENSVIELEKDFKEKYSGFDPSKDESYIIFEMAQKKTLAQSLKFANMAQRQLVSHAGRKDRGVKQAGFWVLWATSMPAVLVELDFICNPETAAYMGSEKGQKELAESIFSAVKSYFNNYTGTSRAFTDSQKSSTGRLTASASAPSKGTTTPSAKPQGKEAESKETKETKDGKGASNVLVKVDKTSRTDAPPATAGTGYTRKASSQRSTAYSEARRRRSNASRQASIQTEVTKATIPLKKETAYLAREEKVKVVETKVETKRAETPAERKKRLKEEKKKAKEEAKRLKDQKRLASTEVKNSKQKEAGIKKSNGQTVYRVTNSQSTASSTAKNTKTIATQKDSKAETKKETKRRTSLSNHRQKEEAKNG